MTLETVNDGRYSLQEFLGDGRFAVVFRAQDAERERPIALKLLREEHVDGDPKWREAFDIEVALLEELHGLPTVVTMTDHGMTEDGRNYIGLELLPPGTDLLTRVTHDGAFSEEEGLPILWQLTHLLRKAHAHDIAYRDLKLEHIFWSDDQMTLIDWNVSRKYSANSSQESFDLEWERERNFQGDLFKLGTMFYSVFTGLDIRDRQVPTPVYSKLEETGLSITDEGIVWPIDFADAPITPEMKDIIRRLVHIDLEQRYDTAAGVAQALEEHAQRLGITLEPPAEEPQPVEQPQATEQPAEPPQDRTTAQSNGHYEGWLTKLSNWLKGARS